jgi:hypothetical protein
LSGAFAGIDGLHAALSCSRFSCKQAKTASALGILSEHNLNASRVHAARSAAVPELASTARAGPLITNIAVATIPIIRLLKMFLLSVDARLPDEGA